MNKSSKILPSIANVHFQIAQHCGYDLDHAKLTILVPGKNNTMYTKVGLIEHVSDGNTHAHIEVTIWLVPGLSKFLGGNLGGAATKSVGMRLAIMQNMQPVHRSSIPILQQSAVCCSRQGLVNISLYKNNLYIISDLHVCFIPNFYFTILLTFGPDFENLKHNVSSTQMTCPIHQSYSNHHKLVSSPPRMSVQLLGEAKSCFHHHHCASCLGLGK